jgi:hypothetical protein
MMREPKILRCKRCESEFIAKTSNQIFCSHRCKAPLVESYSRRVGEIQTITSECRQCAKEFLKRVTSPGQFCCSQDCYREYVKRTQRESKPLRDCKICGSEFHYTGHSAHTCSLKCKAAYYEKKGIKCYTIRCECGAEMLARKDSKSLKNKRWICHQCLYATAKTIYCDKCGLKTRSFNGRTKCISCEQGVEKKPVVKCDLCESVIRRPGHTRCTYCQERPRQQDRIRTKTKSKKIITPSYPSYPCATCKAGKPNAASEIGWECLRSAAVCKPWAGAVLHEHR